MIARFRELLPWYVNGTLPEDDRLWVDDFLRQNPQARAELLWHESLSDEIRSDAPKVPETIGLARALRMIDAERPTPQQRLLRGISRIGAWVRGDGDAGAGSGGFALRPSLALGLLGLLILQFGVISGQLLDIRESSEIRAGQAQPVLDGPLLKVTFASDAKEVDMRFALIAVQGILVGGPGQLGDYYVRVPKGSAAAAQPRLRSQPGVLSVEIVPGLPARP